MALPYVCILDWDGTIVGKVDYQSQAYVLVNTLRKNGIKTPNVNTDAFGKEHKLVRPYFADFIKTLERFFGADGGIHFFIYTASMRNWALQEISWVEKAHGIQFMRPIFTRDDCIEDNGGGYVKSLTKVLPRIFRSLGIRDPATRRWIVEHQLMIIDNRMVWKDHVDKLILCPDYDYAVFDNLSNYIPASVRNSESVKGIIYSLANSGLLCPEACGKTATDPMCALAESYAWLAAKCKAITDENRVYENDDFWRYLRKLITQNHLRQFSVNVIKQLQAAAWQHAKRVTKAQRLRHS